MVGDIAEQPAAERAHEERCSKKHRGVELLHHRVAVREEGRGEIQRERRIGVKIVPLDEIADGADKDGLYPAFDVMNIETVVGAHAYSLVCHFGSPEVL